MEATDDQYLRSSLIRLNRILDFKRKTKITGLLFRVIKVEQVEGMHFSHSAHSGAWSNSWCDTHRDVYMMGNHHCLWVYGNSRNSWKPLVVCYHFSFLFLSISTMWFDFYFFLVTQRIGSDVTRKNQLETHCDSPDFLILFLYIVEAILFYHRRLIFSFLFCKDIFEYLLSFPQVFPPLFVQSTSWFHVTILRHSTLNDRYVRVRNSRPPIKENENWNS